MAIAPCYKDAPVLTDNLSENKFPKIAIKNLSKIGYGEVVFFTISRTQERIIHEALKHGWFGQN